MLWDHEIPRVRHVDDDGRSTEITVVAGALDGARPPSPPPRSWAARPDSDVAIWHLRLDPGARWNLPPARFADTVRVVYVFDGGPVEMGGDPVGHGHGAVVQAGEPVTVASVLGAECLVLQGRPIGEPVAQYGPFVMNSQREIEQAFADYRRTGFGGWPWPSEEPVHSLDPARFARHEDGRTDRPNLTSTTA
jgi:redox-sensitive bicupin YhaK (pirin superfamily)